MPVIARSIFVSVFFLSTIHSAFSFYVTENHQCSLVDLRSEFPLKMRNQGDISWCYGHAAADYLQFLNRLPIQISAADIAIHYNQRRWPRFLRWLKGTVVSEAGFIRSALYDISSVGYCPEEYFPSDTWTKRIMIGKQAGETVQVTLKKAIEEITDLVNQVEDGIYLSPSDLPYFYEFKDVTHQQFYEAIFTNPSGDILNELRSAACDAHRMPFPKILTSINMNFKGRHAFDRINQVLDENMPLSVDFFYGLLENRDSYKRTVGELHTTLMMGRRFDPETDECQYLIKNSYGTDCSKYDPRHKCEEGYLWVSESSLYRAMTSYVYISGTEDFKGTFGQRQDE